MKIRQEGGRRRVEKRQRRGVVLLVVASLLFFASTPGALAQRKKDKAVDTGKAAGIGALLGFALGRDPLLGAAGGAALGAAGGMIAHEVQKGKTEKKAAQEAAELETREEAARDADSRAWEADLAARERRLREMEQRMNQTVAAANQLEAEFVELIGPDNWEGYEALRACQHPRAVALAGVAATSEVLDHQVAAVWLEAMAAADQRQKKKVGQLYLDLVRLDPDIDTVQQASVGVDQAVLELRAERRNLGIPACG